MKNFKFRIGSKSYAVDIVNMGDKMATVDVNGTLYEVEVDQKLRNKKTPAPGRNHFVPSTDTPPAKTNAAENGSVVRSPLPGKIIDIAVKAGDTVSIGQTVVCIEAMKMENNIRIDREGTIKAVNVQPNEVVMEGASLLEIE